MGKRGPPKQPTHLKIMRGNPGHRPLNKNEPSNRDGNGECPVEFDEDTKAEWGRILDQLQGMGVWSAEFRAGLIEYCEAFALKHQALGMYRNKQVPIIQTRHGNWVQHPLLATINKQKAIMYRWLCEFGMTPASRSNVQDKGISKPKIGTRARA